MQAIDADSGSADAGGEAPGRFVLPRRTFLLALAGIVVLLMLLVAGGVAFYSHGKTRAVERAVAQERARAVRAQAVATGAENQEQLAAARRAHEEILETGHLAPPVTPAPAAPLPAAEVASPAPASAAAAPVPPVAAAVPVASATAAPPPVEKATRKKPAPAKREEASAVPSPSGCAVGGSNPQDYGQALGRCLEEFSRQEGRR